MIQRHMSGVARVDLVIKGKFSMVLFGCSQKIADKPTKRYHIVIQHGQFLNVTF